MPYTIAVDDKRRLVIVVVTGAVNSDLAKPMVTEARAAAGPRGFNILYDFRGATPGNVKSSDVFWYPRQIPALVADEARRIRTAVLHCPEQREIMRFWETTFTNVGLQAGAFENEDEAHHWLADTAKA